SPLSRGVLVGGVCH
ncbi:hypothetical protein F2P56_037253, partial (mitochondrion) [Juglans regia]